MPDTQPDFSGFQDADGNWWDFLTLTNQVRDVTIDIEDVSRPGVDGTAVRQQGQHGKPFEVRAVYDDDSRTAAAQSARDLQALKGTILQEYIDDYGTHHGSMIVWDVEILRNQDLTASSGGLSALAKNLVVARLVLQKTGTIVT